MNSSLKVPAMLVNLPIAKAASPSILASSGSLISLAPFFKAAATPAEKKVVATSNVK
jgi:hypothetical protein